VAEPLGLSVREAARAIYDLVNNNMVEAIKTLSVQRGIDPRDYALVIGGGAGGIHGAELGAEMHIPHVVIPPEAGAFCAMGMIAADLRHDYLRTLPQRSTDWSPDAISDLYEELEAEAIEALAREGVTRADVVLDRYVDAKYQNQLHEITIPVPGGRRIEAEDIEGISRSFHDMHRALYTFAVEDAPLDFYHWRLAAFGRLTQHEQRSAELGPEDPSAASKGTREACFSRDATLSSAGVYDGDGLRPGMKITGPAIIERTTTTVVLRPGDVLRVNEVGAFSIKRQ
jgi:N-methylhydantoinase A